jgi:hypothetical protein
MATPKALLLLDFTFVVEAGVGVPVPVDTGELDVLDVVTGILVVNGKFVTLLAEAKTGSCVANDSTGVPEDDGFSTLSITCSTPFPIMMSGASSCAELMKIALFPVRLMVSFPPSTVVSTVLFVKFVEYMTWLESVWKFMIFARSELLMLVIAEPRAWKAAFCGAKMVRSGVVRSALSTPAA